MSQANKILEYMKRHGSITSLEAMTHIGCMRLSSRIHDLKQKGYVISSDLEYRPTRSGDKVRVAVYRLQEGNNK